MEFLMHKFNSDPLFKCLHNTREKALLIKLINAVEKQDGDTFDQAIAQYADQNGALDDTSHRLLTKVKAAKFPAFHAGLHNTRVANHGAHLRLKLFLRDGRAVPIRQRSCERAASGNGGPAGPRGE
jgi:hypothetical protein